METGLLTAGDWVVIGVYLIGMVVLGWWISKRQKTSEDYFVAGRRMGWFTLSISIWVSLLSANSMLGCPGYAYEHDLQFLPVMWLLPIPMSLVIIYTILPVFHALTLTTAYTYLERRYGLSVRMVGSILFILLRGGWLATVIYAPSVALSAVIDIPGIAEHQETWAIILTLGVVATIYTTMGGIEADIWSDVIQFFVLVGGMGLICFYVLRDMQGWHRVWDIAKQTQRSYPMSSGKEFWDWVLNPNLKFSVELTFLWILVGTTLGRINDGGTDQLTLQRYFSARSIRESIRAIWIAHIVNFPLLPLLYFTGTAIFVYFHIYGDNFANLPQNPDQMLPYFVAAVLPVGISGLFIAALFAATMSSVDSGMNSLSATCITDYYRRLRGTESTESSRRSFDKFVAALGAVVITGILVAIGLGMVPSTWIAAQGSIGLLIVALAVACVAVIVGLLVYSSVTRPLLRRALARSQPEVADEAHYLRASRYTTIFWGLTATLVALFVGQLGQIYKIAVMLMGFWTGPLLGIFLLGLFTRRANATGVIAGAIIGAICAGIWALVLDYTPWLYAFVGLVPTLAVGYLVSMATAPPEPEQIAGMTLYTRFRLDEDR